MVDDGVHPGERPVQRAALNPRLREDVEDDVDRADERPEDDVRHQAKVARSGDVEGGLRGGHEEGSLGHQGGP